jgi:uncharacterized coiled-coil protein SlyX
MKGSLKHAVWIVALALAGSVAGAASAADDKVERLESLVEKQQRLIEEQGRMLEEQGRRLESQEKRMERLSDRMRSMRRANRTILMSDDDALDNQVTSGSKDVKLAISGQIHRAMNLLDDGDSTDLYHVDADTSNTRVRFVGTGRVTDDVTLGTNIELAISPNNSGDVSQDDQNAGDTFDQRIAEIFLDSEDYGRLAMGKGPSASDGTAEVDLSGTDLVAYSGWSGLVGGIFFYDDDDDDLSDATISGGFGNRDGLGRENRIAYETPKFFGVQLAAGANADERYDGAIRWAGQGYGFKVAAAGGIADYERSDDPKYRLSGSVSTLHEATGLNLTLAGGFDDSRPDPRDGDADCGVTLDCRDSDGSHLYAKLGLIRSLFDVGDTAFAVDFTRTQNLPTADDDGQAIGAIVVQHFDRWGADLYSQFRWIELDRRGPFDLEDVNVGTAGVRVKF